MSTIEATMRTNVAEMEPDEDRSLVESLARGDRRAAEELVERSYRSVYAALVRLTGGDADLAADLTQETYRKAWKALDGFGRRSRFSTWLYRIAYNTFLNHVRRPLRAVPLVAEEAGEMVDPCPPVSERMADAGTRESVRRAVMTLPEELRFTVTARYWGGYSVAEIARLERVTTVAIRKRLNKACKLLAAALEEEGR